VEEGLKYVDDMAKVVILDKLVVCCAAGQQENNEFILETLAWSLVQERSSYLQG
jgi:hypothetical protein